jgi:hypothetical protein
MLKYLLSIVAVLLSMSAFSQSMTFHRAYPVKAPALNKPDTSALNFSVLQQKDESYITMEGFIGKGDSTASYLVFTIFNTKGDPKISKALKFNDAKFKIVPGSYSLIKSTKDSIYFTCTLNDGDDRHLLGVFNKDLSKVNTRLFDITPKAVAGGTDHLIVEGADSSMVQVIEFNDATSSSLYVNKFDQKLKNLTTRKFQYKLNTTTGAGNINLQDLRLMKDSTYVMTGGFVHPTLGTSAAIIMFDKTANSKHAKTYTSTDSKFTPITTSQHILKVGKEFFIAGQYINKNTATPAASYTGSFVLKTNAKGDVVWSKIIDSLVSPGNIISGLTIAPGGSVIVAGKTKNKDGKVVPFMAALTQADGTQEWFNTYPRSETTLSVAGGKLITTKDLGFAYFYSDLMGSGSTKYYSSLIKTDALGKSSCETAVTTVLFKNHKFRADTLISTAESTTSKFTNLDSKIRQLNVPYDVANSGPEVVFFCPNVPINYTFKKKLQGAIKWKWDDKSTADTLRVTKKGDYSVTITMNDRYCYELCDTNKIDIYEKPTITAFIPGQFCEGAPVTITTQLKAQAQPVKAAWSTGQVDVGEIKVLAKGTYTVTVTDNCKETATSSAKVDDNTFFGPPSIGVAEPPKVCTGAAFTLGGSAGGGGGTYTYVWNTGETASTIRPTTLGTYTLTVTDACKKTNSKAITINNSVYFGAPTAAIASIVDKICTGADFNLNAAASGGGGAPYKYLWSNNATTQVVTSKVLGTYTVTVTDNCGLTGSTNKGIDNTVYFPNPTVSLTQSNATYCTSGKVSLFASAQTQSSSISNYKWSNGNSSGPGNQATIGIETAGSYSVIVTDVCNNSGTTSINVTNLGSATSCIKFPNVFFPNSNEQNTIDNRYFGGFNQCGADSSNVQSYKLRVYNRWGNEVFSGDKVKDKWYGTKGANRDDPEYPGDVYVWYVQYNAGPFCKVEQKGDVTLIRD